jgi:hypothetical protein
MSSLGQSEPPCSAPDAAGISLGEQPCSDALPLCFAPAPALGGERCSYPSPCVRVCVCVCMCVCVCGCVFVCVCRVYCM